MKIDLIIKNGKIKSLSAEGGIGTTHEAHLATYKGKKYLLRICKDVDTAKKYLKYYKKFKKYNFFPKLLEFEGNYLLFEFINGRECLEENEDQKVIYQVGKICAAINKSKPDKSYQIPKNFHKKLKEISDNQVITKELESKIIKVYNRLKKKVKLIASIDAGDVTNDNFMVDKKGKVFFVDIEAINPNIKGIGIAKSFSSWFKIEKDRVYFKKGYESISPMKFYNTNYAKLVTLIFYISRIRTQYKRGKLDIVKRTIYKLERLLEE